MIIKERKKITVETSVKAPLEKVWEFWTSPEHIEEWNNPSDDWHTSKAENNLRVGGRFRYHMEAKDRSAGFDFTGVYDQIEVNHLIIFTIDEGRNVKITFSTNGTETKIVETFEVENENSIIVQRSGWQAILDNFKKYTETN